MDVELRNAEVVIGLPNDTRLSVLVNVDPIRDERGRLPGAINRFQGLALLDRRRFHVIASDIGSTALALSSQGPCKSRFAQRQRVAPASLAPQNVPAASAARAALDAACSPRRPISSRGAAPRS